MTKQNMVQERYDEDRQEREKYRSTPGVGHQRERGYNPDDRGRYQAGNAAYSPHSQYGAEHDRYRRTGNENRDSPRFLSPRFNSYDEIRRDNFGYPEVERYSQGLGSYGEEGGSVEGGYSGYWPQHETDFYAQEHSDAGASWRGRVYSGQPAHFHGGIQSWDWPHGSHVPNSGGHGGYGGANEGYRGWARHDHSGHIDPDYHQWRSEQLRNLDRDYEDWRQERYRKFSDDFSNWRSTRPSREHSPAGESSAVVDAAAEKGAAAQTGVSSSHDEEKQFHP